MQQKQFSAKHIFIYAPVTAGLFFLFSFFLNHRKAEHEEKRQPPPPPPQASSVTNLIVKPVASVKSLAREPLKPELAESVDETIICVTGKDPETATRYMRRSRALATLPDDLSQGDVQALINYLAEHTEADPLRPERVDALKNDIMNLLRRQKTLPEQLIPSLITIYHDRVQRMVVRDYCIQHLGILQQQTSDLEALEAIYECLVDAARTPGVPYAGTALIALIQIPDPTEEARAFTQERAVRIARDHDSHTAARISAIQIAAETGRGEIRPFLLEQAAAGYAPVSLRTAALGALGTLGTKDDLTILAALRPAISPRLKYPLETAIQRIQERYP